MSYIIGHCCFDDWHKILKLALSSCLQVFRLQPDNGIPIKTWVDDESDSSLMSLLPFLETLADVDDVRPIIAQKFRALQILVILTQFHFYWSGGSLGLLCEGVAEVLVPRITCPIVHILSSNNPTRVSINAFSMFRKQFCLDFFFFLGFYLATFPGFLIVFYNRESS